MTQTGTDLTPHGNGAVEQAEPEGVNALVRLAIDKNVPVEVLERLVALQERVTERNARAEYFGALAKFQQECPPINTSKTANVVSKRTGTQFSYKYAPLPEITRTILPYLSKHGLSFQWTTEQSADKGVLDVVCIVRHIDGHEERAGFPTPIDSGERMSAAQSNGAALTYGRRQSLIAVLGLTTADVDTDAQEHAEPTPISEAQRDTLSELLDAIGNRPKNESKLLKWLGADTLEEVRAESYEAAKAALEEKRAAR